jgi:hypothetical protein
VGRWGGRDRPLRGWKRPAGHKSAGRVLGLAGLSVSSRWGGAIARVRLSAARGWPPDGGKKTLCGSQVRGAFWAIFRRAGWL